MEIPVGDDLRDFVRVRVSSVLQDFRLNEPEKICHDAYLQGFRDAMKIIIAEC